MADTNSFLSTSEGVALEISRRVLEDYPPNSQGGLSKADAKIPRDQCIMGNGCHGLDERCLQRYNISVRDQRAEEMAQLVKSFTYRRENSCSKL